MREKINKAGKKSIIFSSPYISHRDDFGLDQKRKSGHQALTHTIYICLKLWMILMICEDGQFHLPLD